MSISAATAGGVPRGVLVAAVATGLSAVPLAAGLSEAMLPTGALYGAGWPALGVAAALLLDRAEDRRTGPALVVLALVPPVMVLTALVVTPAGDPLWTRVEDVWQAADVVAVLVTLVVVCWAVGCAPGRTPGRRLFWIVVWSGVVTAAVIVADAALDPRAEALVLTAALWSVAGLVARLTIATELRPVDEPLLDVTAAVLTVAAGVAAGGILRVVGTRAGVPAPDLAAAFTGVASTALVWPAAAWWRRSRLTARYGTGVLSPADVASLTAGLHRLSDPRELLAKAAEMVGACSGHREVALVLGEDAPDVPRGWSDHVLLVAGDRVGTLMLNPEDPEGPEPRQARTIEQLLPSVALVCRAVGLAVEAEHARRDVARERDAERARILADLHDGLGPVLAGMSMRVQAHLRRSPTPLLESLAPALAEARTDLRRIVAGLTPSALHDADLTEALQGLVAAFREEEREIELEIALERPLPGAVAVTAYRCVSEGIANAVRHGRASHVAILLELDTVGRVTIDVRDDGVGGPVAPGVGLTSLRQRAEQLGGSLSVRPNDGGGTVLHVVLPVEHVA